MKQISIQSDKIQSRSKTNGVWSEWSEISGNGGADIDDTTTSLNKTWSSSKTSTELGTKVDKNGTDRLITQSEADKLSGINEHWKGSYISLAALKAAHPTANPGDEATIDAGVGTQAQKAIWDDTDGDWYISSGTPITVDQSINEGSINPVAGGAVFSGLANKISKNGTDRLVTENEISLWSKDPICFVCSDETSDLTASGSVSKLHFVFPDSRSLLELFFELNTAAVGGSLTVDVKKNGTSIFSTLLTFDSGETTTRTASVPYVLTGAISFVKGDYIDVYITNVGSSTAGKGLKGYFITQKL